MLLLFFVAWSRLLFSFIDVCVYSKLISGLIGSGFAGAVQGIRVLGAAMGVVQSGIIK